jgi:hypothetical protein
VRAQAFPEVNFGANVIRWRDPSLLNPSGLDKFPEELRNALVPTSVNLFDYSVSLSPCKVEAHARASEMRLTRPTTSRSPMYICDRLDRPIGGILPLVLRTESSAYTQPKSGCCDCPTSQSLRPQIMKPKRAPCVEKRAPHYISPPHALRYACTNSGSRNAVSYSDGVARLSCRKEAPCPLKR